MASDEELARQVALAERDEGTQRSGGTAVQAELDEYKNVASEIHDELARRIEVLDDGKADDDSLDAVLDRLDRLESRLDDLESRL
jgi:uncharacterized protein Yka (UPF0111/DUF47 family)